MAHHSSHGDEDFRKFFAGIPQEKLGATGLFPLGKLVPSDEGETRIAIGSDKGKVIVDFGTPTAWIGFTPSQARDLAQTLIKHADSIDRP